MLCCAVLMMWGFGLINFVEVVFFLGKWVWWYEDEVGEEEQDGFDGSMSLLLCLCVS